MGSEQLSPKPATFRPRWTWVFLAAIVLFAFNAYSLIQFSHRSDPPWPYGDGPDYESLAYSLSMGDGFQFAWEDPRWQAPYRDSALAAEYSQFQRRDLPGPTTSRPPALPWLISQVYRWIPRGPDAFACVRWLSLVALTLAGALAVWLASSWTAELLSPKVRSPVYFAALAALVALGLAGVDRTIKTYMHDFLTEPWAALGVTILAWCLMRWAHGYGSLYWMIVSGAVFGVMILFRSLFIFWLPVVAVGIFLLSNQAPAARTVRWFERVRCFELGVFFVVVCLVAGPWWVRNGSITGRWMPMGAQGAAALRGGYSDEALADWGNWHSDAEIAMQAKLDRVLGSEGWTAVEREVALADMASVETWDWIGKHWSDLPRLGAMRLVSHWGPWRIDHIVWKFLAFLGWVWIWRRCPRRGIVLASIFLADALTTALLYETGGRFLIPLHGLLYALAGVGVAGCLASAGVNPVPTRDEIRDSIGI